MQAVDPASQPSKLCKPAGAADTGDAKAKAAPSGEVAAGAGPGPVRTRVAVRGVHSRLTGWVAYHRTHTACPRHAGASPAPVAPVAPAVQPPAPRAEAATAAAAAPPPSCSAAVPAAAADGSQGSVAAAGREAVGRSIRVYWADDDAWYEGTVTRFEGRKHLVVYEDGDEEWLELGAEKFEWVEGRKLGEGVCGAASAWGEARVFWGTRRSTYCGVAAGVQRGHCRAVHGLHGERKAWRHGPLVGNSICCRRRQAMLAARPSHTAGSLPPAGAAAARKRKATVIESDSDEEPEASGSKYQARPARPGPATPA